MLSESLREVEMARVALDENCLLLDEKVYADVVRARKQERKALAGEPKWAAGTDMAWFCMMTQFFCTTITSSIEKAGKK